MLWKNLINFNLFRPIDSSNKGRQMLEKLGWTTGQGLGRSNTGIVEPVNSICLPGLGHIFINRSVMK